MNLEKIDDIVYEIGELGYAIDEELKIVKKKISDIKDSIKFIEKSNVTISKLQFELLEHTGWKPEQSNERRRQQWVALE